MAILAGCGGGTVETRPIGEIADCLGEVAGASVSEDEQDMDLIAEDAGVGAVRIEWERNEAHVLEERSEDDARDAMAAYEAFGGTDLERHGTVVVAWTNSPTDEEQAAVTECIEPSEGG